MDARGYYQRAHQKPRPGANWPLWVILGVFVLGVLGVVFTLGGKTPLRTEPSATSKHPEMSDACADCLALEVGCCYSLSADTPLCEECGVKLTEDNATGRSILPARTQVGIMKASSAGGARWYYVQAVASDGKTKLGTGWISSDSLKTQSMRFLK